MKRIGALLLGLLLTGVFTLPAWAGTLTTNKFFYKPSPGARGDTEKKTFDAGLDRIDARLGKEIWVGDPNYGATLQDAVTAIGSVNKTTLRIPAGAWAITSYLAIPANITLAFESGGYLDLTGLPSADIEGLTSSGSVTIVTWTGHGLNTGDMVSFSGIAQYKEGTAPLWSSSGQWMTFNFLPWTITKIDNNSFSIGYNSSTWDAYVPATDPGKVNVCVKISGEVKASRTKIFHYTGKHAALYLYPTSQQIDLYPEWFGAVGDQTTDDLQAFDQAIGTAKLRSAGVIHLSRLYKLSDTLSVNDISGQRIIIRGENRNRTGIVSFANGYPALEVIGAQADVFENFRITGNKLTGTPPTSLIPSVAIAVGRSKQWPTGADHMFRELYIDGYFQYGEILLLKGSSCTFDRVQTYTGIPNAPYNNRKFCVGIMGDNLYNISARNSVFSTLTAGAADMNAFYNCQFMGANSSAIPVDCAAYLLQKAPYTVFRDVYTQGVTSAVADMFALTEGGGSLSVYHCPIESTHRYTFNVSSTVPGTYCADITAIDVRGSAAPTAIIKSDTNTILRRWFMLGGSYNSHILLGGGSMNSTFKNFNTLLSFVVSGGPFIGNLVELPDSTPATNFDLSGSTNVKNNLITDLRGIAGTGGYQTLIDGDLRIGQPSFVTPNILTLNTYKTTWAAAAPTSGSWTRGSVIWNTGATSGGSPGWVCVLDTTFGTLNGGATTGDITTGTKLLTVNSVTGMTIGNYIDIAGVSGPKRITNIDTANKIVTIDSNANATVTGAAISFHNHTSADAFKAMANLQ